MIERQVVQEKHHALDLPPGVMKYTYPTLNREQEQITFAFLKSGTSLTTLTNSQEFQKTIPNHARDAFNRASKNSETIEHFILNCNLHLVHAIAEVYEAGHTNTSDIVSSGIEGLLQAIRRFDPAQEARFSTFAVRYIRGHIVDERWKQGTIHLPANMWRVLNETSRISEAFQKIFEREPTPGELQKQLIANTNISTSTIHFVLGKIQSGEFTPEYLNDPIESIDSLSEQLAWIQDPSTDVEQEVIDDSDQQQMRQNIRKTMEQNLSSEEYDILAALFGIERPQKLPRQVAREREISILEVEEIKNRSLEKLRIDTELQEATGRAPQTSQCHLEKSEHQPEQENKTVKLLNDVKTLHDEGSTINATADQLDQKYIAIRMATNILIWFGHIQSTKNFEQNRQERIEPTEALGQFVNSVQALRQRGYNNIQIAKMLDMPKNLVAACTSLLISTKEIEPFLKQNEDTFSQVEELRNRGFDNEEIAQMLGISKITAEIYASRLICLGRIKSLPQTRRNIIRLRSDDEKQLRKAVCSEETDAVKRYLEEHPKPEYRTTFNRFFKTA